MSKRALFVGIDNYINPKKGKEDPKWKLQGCVADAKSFHKLVTSPLLRFRAGEETALLLDRRATRKKIEEGLDWLLDDAAYTGGGDDVRLFYFAGHGTYVADESGDEAGPGGERDEVLVTHDHSWKRPLRDDDLRRIFDRIPKDVTFTFIADCCHSGTLQHHDAPMPPIDPLKPGKAPPRPTRLKRRFLRPPSEVRDQVGARREEIEHRLAQQLEPLTSSRAAGYMQELEEQFEIRSRENRFEYVSVDRHVLLAACRDTQYSKEVLSDKGTIRGAFTWALEQALTGAGKPLTYRQLMELAASRLRSQTPQLECPEKVRDCSFLAPHRGAVQPDAPDTEPAPADPTPQEPPPTGKTKENPMPSNLVRFLTVLGSQEDKKGNDGFWSDDWNNSQRELAMRMAGLTEFEKALVKKRDADLIDGYLGLSGSRPIPREGGGDRPVPQEGGGDRPIPREGGGD